jgi:uncharacterized Fe-S radical SAM superfamily protein PflX
MQDHVLVGRKEIAAYLRIEVRWLTAINKAVEGGVPHAILGKSWVSTTHTLLEWMTELVRSRAVVVYNIPDKKWRPSPEVVRRFSREKVKATVEAAVEKGVKKKIKVWRDGR